MGLNVRTETSHHDLSQDDEKKWSENYENIFGKAWYEEEDDSKEKNK